MDEKLIQFVRKCEELYDMSNKKYSDSVWKEKLWGQIGEEVENSDKFQCFYCAFSRDFTKYFAITIILLSPKF